MPDRAAQIQALKEQYPGHRVVSFKGDPTVIVLRKPTEQEVLTIMDKGHLASIVNPGDNAYNYDNGNAEILALAVAPDAKAVERLAERRPRLASTLFSEVQKLCPAKLEDQPAKEGQLAFLLNGKTPVVLALLSRGQYELLDFQRLKSDHETMLPSWMAKAARQSVVSHQGAEAEALFAEHPTLSLRLGQKLLRELTLEVEEEEGK